MRALLEISSACLCREGSRPRREARAAPTAARSHNSLSGRCGPLGAAPRPPPAPRWGPGGGEGGPAAAAPRISFIPSRTHDTEPTQKPSETRALSAFKGWGEWGGVPATQQQPRLRAVAGVRDPCAPRAARRPTLHKGSMALPPGSGSPGAAAALPGPGERGSPYCHPSPPRLLVPPPRSRAGQPGGTQRPAPSSAAVAAAARTVTLAAFAAIYIHTIGFHS